MGEVLTDIDFIRGGFVFPPYRSKDRLQMYEENMKRYSNRYSDRKIKVKTANGYKSLDWGIASTNYFKLVTDKTLGLILNEKPLISVTDEEADKVLNDMIEDSNLWLHFQDYLRSFSSLGDGVMYVYRGKDGVKLNTINPSSWYKVVDKTNINNVICHVLVQEIFEVDYQNISGEELTTHLRVLYHYKGYYVEKYYRYNGDVIGGSVDYELCDGSIVSKEGRRVETGLTNFAIVDINNSRNIDSVYGVSDYEAFDDLVLLKEKKIAQLDAVTDKHFDPILQAPPEAFKNNEQTGEREFNGLGNIVQVREGTNGYKYVSWDAKTEAVITLIERIDTEVSILSEMGKSFLFGEFGDVSGEALKVMIKGALDKISRHIDTLEGAFKTILVSILELGGITIRSSDISITWQDGITESDNLRSQTIATRVGSGTMSKVTALQRFDGLTEEQAIKEVELIKNGS